MGYATIAYNSIEGVIAVASGLAAGSIALIGFGVDSFIELAAGVAALWRLYAHASSSTRERVERVAQCIVGLCFLGLALYVAQDAIRSLRLRERPDESVIGIALAALSLLVMPLLARAKRHVAFGVGSRALAAEANQTQLCSYLSAILLGGLLLNATLGWWWADPVAAVAMVPIIANEGVDALRGKTACGECCA